MPSRKHILLAVKAGLSGFLIWLVFSQIDGQQVFALLLDMAPGAAMMSLAVILIQVLPAALRWTAVLDTIGSPLKLSRASRYIFIGLFFNQALPSSLGGDAVRIYLIHRDGMPLRHAANGIILERAATIAAMVVLLIVLAPFFLPELDQPAQYWTLISLAALFFLCLLGWGSILLVDRLPERTGQWRVVSAIRKLADDACKSFGAPAPLVRILGWGIICHVVVAISVYFIAMGLGIKLSMLQCQFLVPLANLISMLPFTIAGWGLREGAMVILLGMVGVAPENALGISILYGIVVLISGLPGGILWFAEGASSRHLGIKN